MNNPNAPLPGRRGAMALGAGLLLAGSQPARAITMADVKPPSFPLERGAKLRVLRPAKYIDPDEAIFNANTRRFTEQTGIEVRVDYVNWPDMPVQVAVATNTGQGADVIIGFSADPHLYADKLLEVTDLADYLGAKYGGWYELAETYGRRWKSKAWLGLPMGGTTGPVVYRKSWVKEAGFEKIPNDLGEFLKLCQGLKRIGHPCGFALSATPRATRRATRTGCCGRTAHRWWTRKARSRWTARRRRVRWIMPRPCRRRWSPGPWPGAGSATTAPSSRAISA